MPVIMMDSIKRQTLRDHPDWLFVFGDNFARTGLGGHAREMRGEPNAVGIVTKRLPSMCDDAFLTDDDLQKWNEAVRNQFSLLHKALHDGKVVVIPSTGIGTGLAQLETRAPIISRMLNLKLRLLEVVGGHDGCSSV